ncbi:MAG: hypothetical protein R3F20_20090, partial [Planctomycetota bacterium]
APPVGRWERWRRRLWNERTRPYFSAAALVLAAYNKPILAALGLGPLWYLWRTAGRRRGLEWMLGGALATLTVCGLSLALTPTPTAYLGVERQGVRVESFDRMPELPTTELGAATPDSGAAAPAPSLGPRLFGKLMNSWWWIFRRPDVDAHLLTNLGYFFVGRHTGLFLYSPFVLLCLGLFALDRGRSSARWVVLGSLAIVALFFLTLIPFNWHGGGGFVGNRYFVNALPGFLFLVRRIRPAWLPAVGFAVGGLFVGPLVFSPYGAIVPSPTLQSHTRNRSFQLFPLEQTIRGQIPGYRGYVGGSGIFFFGRTDLFRPVGDALWIAGGQPVRLDLRTEEPLRRPVFQVRTITAPNQIDLALGGSRRGTHFATTEPAGDTTRIVLEPRTPRVRKTLEGFPYYDYSLTVDAQHQSWYLEVIPTRNRKANRDAAAAAGTPRAGGIPVTGWEEQDLEMLVGAIVTYLGEEEELDWDLFAIDWLDVPELGTQTPGSTVQFRGRVRNASAHPWRAKGATRVALAYHLFDEQGERVEWDGLRALLPRDVAPGEAVDVTFEIAVPKRTGRFFVDFDAVREQVAWFSDRRPGSSVRRTLDVARPEP